MREIAEKYVRIIACWILWHFSRNIIIGYFERIPGVTRREQTFPSKYNLKIEDSSQISLSLSTTNKIRPFQLYRRIH